MGDVIGFISFPPNFWKPLKPLPKMQCYWCEKEIDGPMVWVQRMYACHAGRCCTREARKLMREAR